MGAFSKLAGGNSAKVLGLVLMVLTIIPAVIKTCSVTVHQGEVAYLIWRGKVVRRGHFMYPLRDFMRKLLFMYPWIRLEFAPKIYTQGRHWHIPVLSRYHIESTANRTHDTQVIFYRFDAVLECRLKFVAEVQIVWGAVRHPILNPFKQLFVVDGIVSAFLYLWHAIFNPTHFQELALGLIKESIRSTFANPDFPEKYFQDSAKVYEASVARCKDELLLKYFSDFRELHITDVSPESVQTEQIASAIRSLNTAQSATGFVARLVRLITAIFKSS